MSYRPDCLQCRAIRRPCHRHRPAPPAPPPAARHASYHAYMLGELSHWQRRARENGWGTRADQRRSYAEAARMAAELTAIGTPSYLPEAPR